MKYPSHPLLAAALVAISSCPRAQDPVQQRLDRLEQQNAELRRQVLGLGEDLERLRTEPLPATGGGTTGAASLGGYGEFVFTQRSGQTDVFDALRTVLYVGYRFDERWRFQSEIEVEHGSTTANSGTSTSAGEVGVEFAWLEYRACEALWLRAGVQLAPLGLVNENHEPIAFLPVARSQTETRIIPTTWREPGVAAGGELGAFEWKTAALVGFDGEDFDASGLRGGRQKGNRDAADDFGFAARLDWRHDHGLFGGAVWHGRSGQDNRAGSVRIPDLTTTIVELHADLRHERWQLRALWANAFVPDAGRFAAATGKALGDQLSGVYVELGYDIAPWLCRDTASKLQPFVRAEYIDSQAQLPGGAVRDRRQRDEILTFGVSWQPMPKIAIKVDYESWDHDPDRLNVGFGYVF